MTRQRKQSILAGLFVGVLFVVGLQTFVPFLPIGGKLRGMAEDPPAPVWSLDTILNGEAFRTTDAWFDAKVGLRNFWVRLDSEFTYALFGESIEHPVGTNVVVGAHDWLFERHYVKHAITPGILPAAQVREAIRHMRSVQDKLARRGIPFLLVVAPSKVEIYPEHVPASQLGGRSLGEITTDYERYRPWLLKAGINFYDGRQAFLAWKKAGDRNLFARGGTHWSYDAGLRVLQDLRARLNPLMRHPMPAFIVEKTAIEMPRGFDIDLLNLLNLLTLFPYSHAAPRPVLIPQSAVPTDQLPNILWVHDSFGWPLIELAYEGNVTRPSESLYYLENFYRNPGGVRVDRNVKQVDWNSYLKDQDAVVMVWTEIAFTYLGWGFFEKLDAQLP